VARILAIDPDPARTVILQRLVGEQLNADVVVATSADDAISALATSRPDVILTSSLLAPTEGQQLAAHLRAAPALDYLPVLTIPPFVDDGEDAPTSLLSRFLRRRMPARRAYDVEAVASRIREALAQSTESAREGALSAARLQLLEAPSQDEPEEPADLLRALEAELKRFCGLNPRATRWERSELPWLESIRLTWGAELRLLNISCSGLLVESGLRMTLGNRTDFQLEDCDNRDFVIPGRVVRSDVSSVNSLGVKYVTAAVFEKPFEALGPDGSLPPEVSQGRRMRRQSVGPCL
jgi:DNA-binding NarL/FixJ family response regulator